MLIIAHFLFRAKVTEYSVGTKARFKGERRVGKECTAAPAGAAAVPIPNSPGGPQSFRRKSAVGGGCGDDRVS